MKGGKIVFKELYNFEGYSFNEICKENSAIIHMKKKGKTGIYPVCNKKRRKAMDIIYSLSRPLPS